MPLLTRVLLLGLPWMSTLFNHKTPRANLVYNIPCQIAALVPCLVVYIWQPSRGVQERLILPTRVTTRT